MHSQDPSFGMRLLLLKIGLVRSHCFFFWLGYVCTMKDMERLSRAEATAEVKHSARHTLIRYYVSMYVCMYVCICSYVYVHVYMYV